MLYCSLARRNPIEKGSPHAGLEHTASCSEVERSNHWGTHADILKNTYVHILCFLTDSQEFAIFQNLNEFKYEKTEIEFYK